MLFLKKKKISLNQKSNKLAYLIKWRKFEFKYSSGDRKGQSVLLNSVLLYSPHQSKEVWLETIEPWWEGENLKETTLSAVPVLLESARVKVKGLLLHCLFLGRHLISYLLKDDSICSSLLCPPDLISSAIFFFFFCGDLHQKKVTLIQLWYSQKEILKTNNENALNLHF